MTILFEPETEDDAAGVIRAAHHAGVPLLLAGGGTREGLGNKVSAARTLRTRSLGGIVDYTPAEMTMTARAGTPLAVVLEALSANRQMLAFEPMDHRPLLKTMGEPTIGGVFAANVSGPRRLVAGAARDSLLGIRFVNGRGDIVKSGGRVMKNVTGLDLVKLLAGSHGTLGLLTEVTFRLLPEPPAAVTVRVAGLDDARAAEAMARAMALPVEVSGAAHLPESLCPRMIGGALPEGGATLLRLEGLPASVAVRSEKLLSAMAGFGPVTVIDGEETHRLWREIRDVKPYADGMGHPVWRVSVAPAAGHRLVAALRTRTNVDAFYDWQGGLVWLRMLADAEPDLLRRTIRDVGGGHATLVRASERVRAAIPAFEPQAPAVAALSARLKATFDPKGIFNPGRMGP